MQPLAAAPASTAAMLASTDLALKLVRTNRKQHQGHYRNIRTTVLLSSPLSSQQQRALA
jgi:hypothetical protein